MRQRVLASLVVAAISGALALWALSSAVSSVRSVWEARTWVPVSARVIDVLLDRRKGVVYGLDAYYRYSYKGRDYNGRRISIMASEFAASGWNVEVASYLQDARAREQPVTVYVNDARPTDAVVDRSIRWPTMVALGVAMLVTGGVALTALAIAWFAITRPVGSPRWRAHEEAKRARRAAKGEDSGLWLIWAFVGVWNLVAFYITAVAMSWIQRDENWLGYLILLLPLPGLVLLWHAITTTWAHWRKQPGGIASAPPKPDARPRPRFASDGPAYEFSPREATPSTTVAIPPGVATVHDLGGRITIDYVGPTRTLYGGLKVIAGSGELRVERTAPFGLFKRKDFVAPQADVMTLGASHTNTDTMATPAVRYYRIYAWSNDDRQVTIGRGLPGEDVANALLLRIAKVLEFPVDKVWIARAPSP